jgi:lysyl-tRNA synthetase class II
MGEGVRDQPEFPQRGISTRHNPEFTMLEFYEAYQDYRYPWTSPRPAGEAQRRSSATTLTVGETTIDLASRSTAHDGRGDQRTTRYHRRARKAEYLKVALAPLDVEVFASDGVGCCS